METKQGRTSSEPQVRLGDLDSVLEHLARVLGRNGGVNNDLPSGDPVDGRGDLVGVSELERVDHAEDLVELASGGGLRCWFSGTFDEGVEGTNGVGEDETDRLLGVDHVDCARGQRGTGGEESRGTYRSER